MRAKNSKFLNTAPKILGLKIKEVATSVTSFYIGMLLSGSQLLSLCLAILVLILMIILRKYPSFYVLHYFFRDERLVRPQEVDREDK